ncbi:unnamed protein product [Parascedosporium putredinis]|uniref:Protein kinase domain-containing protein n=1 Tax=Parascedosporium putredinis TaxID=1442378 RepID=A0A9P1GYM2_9PEZI|nr:unnamed protein product [Parascedosporium putredinis]CAI7990884.1 unnamed protein product [Parascedosporium putredinis]
MLRMYHSEVAVYQRLHNVQGKLVPQLITSGFLDGSFMTEVNNQDQTSFQIKGILLQYIEGFTLTNLISQAPQSSWQNIINQAIRITHILGDEEILNADSRLRQGDESDFDWGRAKWQQDEEGAVGLVMRHRLRKLGVEIAFCPSLRYFEFAEREDE